MISLSACQNDKDSDISHYTCPMHPQIKKDGSGNCPICGMTLIPVKKSGQNEANEHHHPNNEDKDNSASEIKINPRYVQNIGVMTEKIQKRNLIKEIPSYGKVAHDHKLWVAQNEFIESLKLGDPTLIKASERKLEFLGLSKQWIQQIRKNRQADISLHLESHNQPTYFEAFIYQEDIGLVQEGLEVLIQDPKGRFLANGTIKSIGTLVDLNSRSVRVLVKSETALPLKLNSFIQVKIKVPLGEKLSIQESAILFNGHNNMTYVDKGQGLFEARGIELGEQAGNYFEVLSGLKEGETVVSNGHFLIDSESQIKIQGMKGHQH